MIVMTPDAGDAEVAAVRVVEPLARAAAAVGADGIIVEVHQDPASALCDGPQALYGRDFAEFASRVAAHASLDGRAIA